MATHKKLFLISLLSIVYGFIFYFIITYQLRLDFYSFYSASIALFHGDNPYQVLSANYFQSAPKLPANLNPPIVLMLFKPLSQLNVHTSIAIWSGCSLLLGFLTVHLATKLVFTDDFLKKYQTIIYILYFSLFSTLMNTWIAQIASITGFGLIAGYYYFKKEQFIPAGIIWGMMIAIKIFPWIVCLYVYKHKRYNMLGIIFATVCLMWLIPLLIYGKEIYIQYLTMLSRVLWYGDSWNASWYGFLFRIFVDY